MLDAARTAALDTAEPDPFHERNGEPCHSIPGWAVVYTHPQAERWADTGLRRAGYVTFLPLATVKRRDRVMRTLWHRVKVPLFSRYLFIRFDHRAASWSPIRAIPGVRDLIRIGAEVQYASEAAVSALEAVQGLAAPPTPWEPGTPCSLVLGPLAGHPAVVLSVHRETAQVAVMLFGALREVQAPIAWLVERT